MNPEFIVLLAKTLQEHQGAETLALDLKGLCSWTDYFILTTAKSETHLKSLAAMTGDRLRENNLRPNVKPNPGQANGWLCLDYGFLVVHIMEKEARQFYKLRDLWFEAKIIYQDSR